MDSHTRLHHDEQHLNSSSFISDIVIGMSDGLTVPFALAAGLSSAVSSNQIIITAGLAEIAAGAIAMGLGGYLSGRTELEHYEAELKREQHEVETVPEREKEEVREVFAEMGLSPATQHLVAEEMSQDKQKWIDFMMKYELGLERPDPKRAYKSALNIGGSYVLGGLVPMSPYFFAATPREGLRYSAVLTVICLFVFGFFKSRAIGHNPWQGALRIMIIGSAAAGAAYFIGTLFA